MKDGSYIGGMDDLERTFDFSFIANYYGTEQLSKNINIGRPVLLITQMRVLIFGFKQGRGIDFGNYLSG